MLDFLYFVKTCDLFNEVRYAKGSQNLIPFDEYDFKYLDKFQNTLETLASQRKIKLTKEDYLDVFAQALRKRYSKRILKNRNRDYQDLYFTLWDKTKDDKGKITKRKAIISDILVKNAPIFPEQLYQKIYDRGYDPYLVDFGAVVSRNQAKHLYEFLNDKQSYLKKHGEPPSYNPPESFRRGTGTSYEEPTKKEYEVKSFDKIYLDKFDKLYLKDVELQLKYFSTLRLINKDISRYLVQALAFRYSDCFVMKKDGEFLPKPEFNEEYSQIKMKMAGGSTKILRVRVNAAELAKKFALVKKKVGYDFLESPLANCKTLELGRSSSGMMSARRWFEQGFFQPMKGTIGSEFIPDHDKLNDIVKQQELYINGKADTPNISKEETPEIEWHDIIVEDVNFAWAKAMHFLRAYLNIDNLKGFTEFLHNEKEDILNSIVSQVEFGLSGKEEYLDQDWRRKRANGLIIRMVQKEIMPKWSQRSINAAAPTADGKDQSSIIAQRREREPSKTVGSSLPELNADNIEAWVNAMFEPSYEQVERRFNKLKNQWEVDPFDADEWYTKQELLNKINSYFGNTL